MAAPMHEDELFKQIMRHIQVSALSSEGHKAAMDYAKQLEERTISGAKSIGLTEEELRTKTAELKAKSEYPDDILPPLNYLGQFRGSRDPKFHDKELKTNYLASLLWFTDVAKVHYEAKRSGYEQFLKFLKETNETLDHAKTEGSVI